MRKIAIIADSAATFNPQIASHPDLFIAQLTLTVDKRDYLDRKDFDHEMLIEAIKADKEMTTAMPSLGEIMRVYKEVESKGYDHIFVLSVSSNVSGTYNGFVLVQNELQIPNLEVIDTYSIAGVVGEMTELVFDLNEQGESLDQIRDAINYLIDNTMVFILPNSLNRLVKSGRVNKAVGTLTSLLKLKVVLIFKNKGKEIEKYDIYRTQKKALDKITEGLKNFGVSAKEWKLIILKSDETSPVKEMVESLKSTFNDVEIILHNLPSTLVLHGGLGTIVIQAVKKYGV